MDIAVLHFFETIRCPFLTVIFSVLSFFGEGAFVAVCAITALWLFDDDRIPVTVLFSVTLNSFLKVTVARPRPFVAGVVSRVEIDTKLVSTLDLKPCESFPSGHSQSLSSLLFSYGYKRKKCRTYLLCGLFCMLVAISRLYLGVHYPTDVLTGLCLGFLAATLWHFLYAHAPKVLPYALYLTAILALVSVLFTASESYITAATGYAGFSAFRPFCKYIPKRRIALPKRLLRFPVGGILAGGVFLLSLALPDALAPLVWFMIAMMALPVARIAFYALKI